ncbi:MAG: hypothetical protein GY716_12405 [bacterium]|nr:hypothetical protein [bacterium]
MPGTRLNVVALCVVAAFAVLSTGAAPYAISPENVSVETIHEVKNNIFGEGQDALAQAFDADSKQYTLSKKQLKELSAADYVMWKKPGYSKSEIAFEWKSGEEWVKDYDGMQAVKHMLEEMGDQPLTATWSKILSETVMIPLKADDPRPWIDVFKLPAIFNDQPRQDATAAKFAEAITLGGHFFSILRVQEDPPQVQEEILYVRFLAGPEAFVLRGPALPVSTK